MGRIADWHILPPNEPIAPIDTGCSERANPGNVRRKYATASYIRAMWTILAILSGAAAGLCLTILGAPELLACIVTAGVVGAVLAGR